jgi:hypothetical protein
MASLHMPYPKMLRVRQRFEAPRLDDVASAVHRELERTRIAQRIRPGQTGAEGLRTLP